MICSTGKQLLWDLMSPLTQEEFSFWTFTFLPTTLSSHPRYTSPPVFITATLTRTEVSVSIFSKTSGVQRWPLARCYFLSVHSLLIQTRMIRWFQILLSSWRRTKEGTTVLLGSGLQSMQCKFMKAMLQTFRHHVMVGRLSSQGSSPIWSLFEFV